MSCNFDVVDYSITIVQGDYVSCLYTITDANELPLNDIKEVIFTCNRLKLQKTLEQIDSTNFELSIDSETTSLLAVCNCTYDITVTFNSEETPITLIHNANLSVLQKENKLNEQV